MLKKMDHLRVLPKRTIDEEARLAFFRLVLSVRYVEPSSEVVCPGYL